MTLKFDDILERLKSRIIRVPPDDCWIWTGAKSQPDVRLIQRSRRDRDFIPERVSVVVKPYAVFKFKGKRTYVHRFLIGADENQRSENHCGNTLCVNPDHWKKSFTPMTGDKAFFDPDTEVSDAKNVIDGIGIPRNLKLEDLLVHPLLVDYSHEAIEQALKELCHV